MTLLNKKIVSYLFLTFLILWTSLILVFSFATGEVSTDQSNFVSDLIVRFLHLFGVSFGTNGLAELNVWVRKLIGHFGLFAVDGFLAMMTLKAFLFRKPIKQFLWVMLFGVGVAILSEIAQLFTPGRAGMALDVAIDVVGFLFGALMGFAIEHLLPPKRKSHE